MTPYYDIFALVDDAPTARSFTVSAIHISFADAPPDRRASDSRIPASHLLGYDDAGYSRCRGFTEWPLGIFRHQGVWRHLQFGPLPLPTVKYFRYANRATSTSRLLISVNAPTLPSSSGDTIELLTPHFLSPRLSKLRGFGRCRSYCGTASMPAPHSHALLAE